MRGNKAKAQIASQRQVKSKMSLSTKQTEDSTIYNSGQPIERSPGYLESPLIDDLNIHHASEGITDSIVSTPTQKIEDSTILRVSSEQ